MPRRVHHLMRMVIHLVHENIITSSKKKQARELLKGGCSEGLTRDEVDAFRKGRGAKPAAAPSLVNSKGASSKSLPVAASESAPTPA